MQAVIFEERRKPGCGWVRGVNVSVERLLIENRALQEKNAKFEHEINNRNYYSRADMAKIMDANIEFGATTNDNEIKRTPHWIEISLKRVVRLEGVFDEPSYESIKGSLEIIAQNCIKSEDRPKVNSLEVDGVILALQRFGIISFDEKSSRNDLKRGPNWLLAHSLAHDTMGDTDLPVLRDENERSGESSPTPPDDAKPQPG